MEGGFQYYLYTILPFIIKISNIKSSVNIIRDWVKLSLFLSGVLYKLHVGFAAAPHHHEWSQFPGSWPSVRMPLPYCDINLVLAPSCSVAFRRKAKDTLGTRLENQVHFFMTSLCNTSCSSLVCSCLNSP